MTPEENRKMKKENRKKNIIANIIVFLFYAVIFGFAVWLNERIYGQ